MFKTPLRLLVIGFKKKNMQRHPTCITDADYDYISDEIERSDKIDFETSVSVNSD